MNLIPFDSAVSTETQSVSFITMALVSLILVDIETSLVFSTLVLFVNRCDELKVLGCFGWRLVTVKLYTIPRKTEYFVIDGGYVTQVRLCKI